MEMISKFIFSAQTFPLNFLTQILNIFMWMSNIHLKLNTLPLLQLTWFLLSLCLPSPLALFLILIRVFRANTLETTASIIFFIQFISNLCHLSSKYIQHWFTSHHFLLSPCHQVTIMSCLDYCNNILTVLPASALSPRIILLTCESDMSLLCSM